jgi:hypothetical protein
MLPDVETATKVFSNCSSLGVKNVNLSLAFSCVWAGPNFAAERVAFLLRIREVPGSNFGPETGYCDRFSSSRQAYAGIVS